MSEYIKLATLEYPRYEGDIRLEYPDMGDEFVCPDTYAPVLASQQPAYDPYQYEYLVHGQPVFTDAWYETWIIETYVPVDIQA